MRGRDLHDLWNLMEPVAGTVLALRGVAPAARELVRLPGALRHALAAEPDDWVVAVRGHGDGTIAAPQPLRFVREAAILDLLSFHPRQPERWRLARGAVLALGAIAPQFFDPEPVAVHRTPLAWLRAGGAGLVLLTRDRFECRHVLFQCEGGIVVDAPAYGAHLKQVLTAPVVEPRIFVAQPGRRA